MKTLGFAIASIVDANTGNGLVQRSPRASLAVLESPRQSRSGLSVGALPGALEATVGSIGRWFARRALNRRRVGELSALTDLQLRDIGMHRGQVEALALGRASFDELDQARRQRSAELLESTASRLAVKALNLPRAAANEEDNNKARCA